MTDPLHDFTDAYDGETKRIVDESDMSDDDKVMAHAMLDNPRRYENMKHLRRYYSGEYLKPLLNPLRDGHPQESNKPREER